MCRCGGPAVLAGPRAGGPAVPSRRMGGREQRCPGAEQSAPADPSPSSLLRAGAVGRFLGLAREMPLCPSPSKFFCPRADWRSGHRWWGCSPSTAALGTVLSPHPVAAAAPVALAARTTGSARVCLRTVCAEARILFTALSAALKMLDSPRLVRSVCLVTASPRSGTGERFLGP